MFSDKNKILACIHIFIQVIIWSDHFFFFQFFSTATKLLTFFQKSTFHPKTNKDSPLKCSTPTNNHKSGQISASLEPLDLDNKPADSLWDLTVHP